MEQKQSQQNTREPLKEQKGSTAVSLVHLSEADLPEVIEKPYEDWVLYGEDNLYPDHLIDAWQQSALHSALTNGISRMIAGEDIVITADPGPASEFNTLRDRVNRTGETLDDLIHKTSFDLYLQGYFGWQIVWNVARTKIVELYHVPAESIRSGKADDQGYIKDYYVSPDWSRYRQKKFKPKRIRAFDETDRSEAVQLMFVRQYRPGQFYYSTPDYIGGMNWIILDNRVSAFHLNNIENGFFPSALIQFFNGEPPQAEKDALESRFSRKFTGKGASKLVFVYNENVDDSVKFDTFEPARLDQRFRELSPEITQKIMTSHRVVSPMLFGVKDQTGWGNNADEIKSASILFNKTVILPYQLLIIRSLMRVLKVNGVTEIDIMLKTLQPLQFVDGVGGQDDASAEVEMRAHSHGEDNRVILEPGRDQEAIDFLKDKGEDIKDYLDNGWWLVQIDDELTDIGKKHKLTPQKYEFGRYPVPTPYKESEQDKGAFRVRYRYAQVPPIETSRQFCAQMVAYSKRGVIYRKEDLDGFDTGGGGSNGSDNLWYYKGGYNCRHWWERLVFVKSVAPGRLLPGHILMPQSNVMPRKWEPNDKRATTPNKPVS